MAALERVELLEKLGTSRVGIVNDHDKNVNRADLGAEHLSHLLGFDSKEEFFEACGWIDEGREPAVNGERVIREENYDSDESYSVGEQLGILESHVGVSRSDLLDQVPDSDDHQFRDGALQFMEDSMQAGAVNQIVSAGDEDFLLALYDELGFVPDENPRFHVYGTRQNWVEEGGELVASGIERGCGNTKKAERYYQEKLAELGENLDVDDPIIQTMAQMDPSPYTAPRMARTLDQWLKNWDIETEYDPETRIVASGDSPKDENLLRFASEVTGGLSIATGERPRDYADVVVGVENDSGGLDRGQTWYGQIAATTAFTGMLEGLTEEEIVDHSSEYLDSVAETGYDHVTVEEGGMNRGREYLGGDWQNVDVGAEVSRLCDRILS